MLKCKLFILCLLYIVFVSESLPAKLFNPPESLAPVVYSSPGEIVDDTSIVQRLLKFYQSVTPPLENRGVSMWQEIFDGHHQSIHRVFASGDFASTTRILRDPGSSSLFFGIDNLYADFQKNMLKAPGHSYAHALICLDGLLRFAQAVGAQRLLHPEAISQFPTQCRAEVVLQKIEQILGITLPIPNPYPNEYGTWTPQGAISYRVPQAMYQAWRIKNLLKDIENPRVLEIGAGVGRTAYYARQLGIQDYTIVDIPFTGMCSGYFLARTLGENHVLLHGETSEKASSCIKIVPPAAFFAGNETYDLIINADSLTELDPSIAQAYFNQLSTRTKIFLSINHEVNPFKVKNLIDGNPHVVHCYRSPYWMRDGYVEEVVMFK